MSRKLTSWQTIERHVQKRLRSALKNCWCLVVGCDEVDHNVYWMHLGRTGGHNSGAEGGNFAPNACTSCNQVGLWRDLQQVYIHVLVGISISRVLKAEPHQVYGVPMPRLRCHLDARSGTKNLFQSLLTFLLYFKFSLIKGKLWQTFTRTPKRNSWGWMGAITKNNDFPTVRSIHRPGAVPTLHANRPPRHCRPCNTRRISPENRTQQKARYFLSFEATSLKPSTAWIVG